MSQSTVTIADQIVAEISRDPRALAVLKTRGINHCCGAHLSLREAAASAGVPLNEVVAAIEAATS